jgi:hypothetical protein
MLTAAPGGFFPRHSSSLHARGLGAKLSAPGSSQGAAGALRRTHFRGGSRRPAGGDGAAAGQPSNWDIMQMLQHMREEQKTMLGSVFDVAAAAVPEQRRRRPYTTPAALASDCGLPHDAAAKRRLAEKLLAEVRGRGWQGGCEAVVQQAASGRRLFLSCSAAACATRLPSLTSLPTLHFAAPLLCSMRQLRRSVSISCVSCRMSRPRLQKPSRQVRGHVLPRPDRAPACLPTSPPSMLPSRLPACMLATAATPFAVLAAPC